MPTPAPKPTVIVFTANEGHYSLAVAAKQVCGDSFEVKEVVNPIMMGKGYVVLYRWFPGFFKLPYQISKWGWVRKLGISSYNKQKGPSFQEIICKEQPIACFSTYFMSTHTLAALKARHGFEIINVVANPRTLHPIEINAEAINCVFDTKTAHDAHQLTANADIRTTGWLVRDEFEEEFSQAQVREKLGLDPAVTTFTIVTGSEGNQKAIAILPTLQKLDMPLQVVVMCGSNKLLFKQIELLAKLSKPNVKVIPIGFQKNIAPYLQAADLVVGKAGPNTVFEAVATHSPFFALSHIAGQEDGNLEIIRTYKIGFVEENTARAGKKLVELAKHPAQLKDFSSALTELARHNHQAKAIIRQMLEELVQEKLHHHIDSIQTQQ